MERLYEWISFNCVITTGTDRPFSIVRDLKPINNNVTTYMVIESYNGSSPLSATACTGMLDGTRYAACTTIYSEYRPSANNTILTVDPQATMANVQNKTPEQIQIEVLDAEWLKIYHEFTWSYPWYRIHAKFTFGAVTFDVGLSPILPSGTTSRIAGLETLFPVLSQVTGEIWQDLAIDIIRLFSSYIAAKVIGIWNEIGGYIAIGVKGFVQWGLLTMDLLNERAGSPKMLAVCIANIFMGTIAIATSIGEKMASALWDLLATPALSAFTLAARGMITVIAPLEIARTRVDYAESLVIDFPIAISAWARYLGVV